MTLNPPDVSKVSNEYYMSLYTASLAFEGGVTKKNNVIWERMFSSTPMNVFRFVHMKGYQILFGKAKWFLTYLNDDINNKYLGDVENKIFTYPTPYITIKYGYEKFYIPTYYANEEKVVGIARRKSNLG